MGGLSRPMFTSAKGSPVIEWTVPVKWAAFVSRISVRFRNGFPSTDSQTLLLMDFPPPFVPFVFALRQPDVTPLFFRQIALMPDLDSCPVLNGMDGESARFVGDGFSRRVGDYCRVVFDEWRHVRPGNRFPRFGIEDDAFDGRSSFKTDVHVSHGVGRLDGEGVVSTSAPVAEVVEGVDDERQFARQRRVERRRSVFADDMPRQHPVREFLPLRSFKPVAECEIPDGVAGLGIADLDRQRRPRFVLERPDRRRARPADAIAVDEDVASVFKPDVMTAGGKNPASAVLAPCTFGKALAVVRADGIARSLEFDGAAGMPLLIVRALPGIRRGENCEKRHTGAQP